MTDQEYLLCMWNKRLWPAKVLCKSGATGKTSLSRGKETSFEVEILGLKEQVHVHCADAVPLTVECIEDIASNLGQRNDSSEAVEELNYRRSLKIALDILTQNGSAGQVPLSEGPNSPLSQENKVGSLSPAPGRRYRSVSKEKVEPETSKKKREPKNSPSLKSTTKAKPQRGSLSPGGSRTTPPSRTTPSRCGTRDSGSTVSPGSQNCKPAESKSPQGRGKIKPRLLSKPNPGNKVSLEPKEEQSKQGRQRPRAVGSPVPRGSDSPGDPAQPPAEEGSPLSVPCTAGTGVSVGRGGTRRQPRRTLLHSSCESASDDLEKRGSSESKSPAKQLDGRKKPESPKRINGEEESGGTVSSSRKRKCRSGPEPPSGPSDHVRLPESFPSQPKEEENQNPPAVLTRKMKQFQLPDFEEEEGLESSDLSLKVASTESPSRLSALLDEEEEDEELPSVLSAQEPQAIEEGILVWCKLRRYPYWPAVVKGVRRKLKKACVLFIDGTTNEKKKGFSVSLKSLKHFDCEEKQDLIERAKEDYCQEIEWCVRLISDYRIRVGCHSFTGSFLEYFAADISYPVRKEGYQSSVQMTFPNEAEENVEESPSEASPPKRSKKLLPDRSRAARDRENKKIVEFIVKAKGAEEHLQAILKSRKQSRWLKEFLNSSQYVTCVETYLEDEEQLDLVVNYLKDVYHGTDAKNLHQIGGDGIKLISDVLLPE
ncbi:PREDICTED: PWWP domain-containing protein MUM1, partial [Merops nubicus]|uniref:PWWP domain-containing protein MUM1 n=1 Tax=Merops nubicus TaxID=57421 RepID=UPI0004F00EE6